MPNRKFQGKIFFLFLLKMIRKANAGWFNECNDSACCLFVCLVHNDEIMEVRYKKKCRNNDKIRKMIHSILVTNILVVMCVICSGHDRFLCFSSILLSLVYFWRCGQIRSGPVRCGWVSCVVLIRPLRDCRGRQQMLVGVNHSALNIPHVWNTMTTQSRHNTHT